MARLPKTNAPADRVDARFTFIDVFAGIGGMRIAFEAAGGQCLAAIEWDRWAQETYQANFGHSPHGDIRDLRADEIAKHDVLVAGFPCQPFSIAGVSKKNALSRPHGFDDKSQGTLFFEIIRLLNYHQPKAVVLENVGNLVRHNGGRTFETIIDHLKAAGYATVAQLESARPYVPQSRTRVLIVGLRDGQRFAFPAPPKSRPTIAPLLDSSVDPKYTLSDKLWGYLQTYKVKHAALGNGFGFGLLDPATDTTARTLSARYYKDGSEILIKQPGRNPRRLTPTECKRLMGFPDWFRIVVSDAQAYRQFGNSVVVPLIERVAKALVPYLDSDNRRPEHEEVVQAKIARVVRRTRSKVSVA